MKSIWYNGVMMRMFIDNPAQKKSEAAVGQDCGFFEELYIRG